MGAALTVNWFDIAVGAICFVSSYLIGCAAFERLFKFLNKRRKAKFERWYAQKKEKAKGTEYECFYD